MEGFMTEHLPLVGRADPLGHAYLPQDHQDHNESRVDSRVACGSVADAFDMEQDGEFCLRRAKDIALSARTHLPVPIWR
jgi:hypothetical protein